MTKYQVILVLCVGMLLTACASPWNVSEQENGVPRYVAKIDEWFLIIVDKTPGTSSERPKMLGLKIAFETCQRQDKHVSTIDERHNDGKSNEAMSDILIHDWNSRERYAFYQISFRCVN